MAQVFDKEISLTFIADLSQPRKLHAYFVTVVARRYGRLLT